MKADRDGSCSLRAIKQTDRASEQGRRRPLPPIGFADAHSFPDSFRIHDANFVRCIPVRCISVHSLSYDRGDECDECDGCDNKGDDSRGGQMTATIRWQ